MATKARGIYKANGQNIRDFYKEFCDFFPSMTEDNIVEMGKAYVRGVSEIMYRPMRAKLAKHARTGETVQFFEKMYREDGQSPHVVNGRIYGGVGICRNDEGAITHETLRRKGEKGGAVGDGPFYRALYQEMGNGGRPGGKFPDEWFEKNIRGTSSKRSALISSLIDQYIRRGV